MNLTRSPLSDNPKSSPWSLHLPLLPGTPTVFILIPNLHSIHQPIASCHTRKYSIILPAQSDKTLLSPVGKSKPSPCLHHLRHVGEHVGEVIMVPVLCKHEHQAAE